MLFTVVSVSHISELEITLLFMERERKPARTLKDYCQLQVIMQNSEDKRSFLFPKQYICLPIQIYMIADGK